MSIWTCSLKQRFPALVLLLTIAGCTQTGFDVGRTAPQTITVANRSVTIGGPAGYCIDQNASKLTGDSAFVVLASCATITQDPQAPSPGHLGLLTASIAAKKGGAADLLQTPGALEAFFASPQGRAALARNGKAQSVEILDRRRIDDAFLVRLRDTSQSDVAGVEDVYWRGLINVNGRLVTVSALSFTDQPMSEAQGLNTIRAFLARIRVETSLKIAA